MAVPLSRGAVRAWLSVREQLEIDPAEDGRFDFAECQKRLIDPMAVSRVALEPGRIELFEETKECRPQRIVIVLPHATVPEDGRVCCDLLSQHRRVPGLMDEIGINDAVATAFAPLTAQQLCQPRFRMGVPFLVTHYEWTSRTRCNPN